MRAGDLRHYVTLVRSTSDDVQTDYGDPVVTWETVANLWAAIEPLSGAERVHADQVHADVSTQMRVRKPGSEVSGGIQPDDRITYGDRTFEIKGVIDVDERGREVVLACRELL